MGRVLIVAGSDSGGGAGIQADVKAVTMLGGYAATAITALTAQNTLGVLGIEPVTPDFVALQMEAVLTDIGADAIKIGMLGSAANVARVAATCRRLAPSVPIVLDPVMIAKGGARLLEPAAERALVGELVPMAAVLTPNVPEAEALSGERITDEAKLLDVASRLLLLGPGAVLLKGGHLEGERVVDYLLTADGTVDRFESPRLRSRSTHGTGCTLASAVAAGIAEGLTLADSVARARRYVLEAIRTAPGLGSGHGPLNHAHPLGATAPAQKANARAN
ncbi:MAG TPA: bifunctional hydroxymethylpyrimidine kinase/phosphomethylpyrimidine kinase [Polyangiaceae bacterium]|nr:bifunctional hydroxymethylpyrimidine kinase/phosphomethylpyrimidine kinase [Polyangiaceae bacterium]